MILLYCYCLAENTWAWMLTEFIPIQDSQWLDTGLSIVASAMKFIIGGWCSP